MLLDIHKLLQGKKDVSHPLIKKFLKDREPYKSLRTYAENSSDVALLKKIKVFTTVKRRERPLETSLGWSDHSCANRVAKSIFLAVGKCPRQASTSNK